MRIWTRTESGYHTTEMYLDEETGRFLGGRRWSNFKPHEGCTAWVLNPYRENIGVFDTQGLSRIAVEKYWAERDGYSPACCTIAATDPEPTV